MLNGVRSKMSHKERLKHNTLDKIKKAVQVNQEARWSHKGRLESKHK